MDEKIPETNVCESCGSTFGCGAKLEGCWCAELTLPQNATMEIKEKFDECLCSDCLKEYASINAAERID